jgi:pimeloyl-ACP methyl ester carboxylesterase
MSNPRLSAAGLGVAALLTLAAVCAGAGAAKAQGRVPVIFLHGIGGSMLAEKNNPEKIYYGNVKETMDRSPSSSCRSTAARTSWFRST